MPQFGGFWRLKWLQPGPPKQIAVNNGTIIVDKNKRAVKIGIKIVCGSPIESGFIPILTKKKEFICS